MLEFWPHDLIPVTFPSPLTSLVTRTTLGPQWVLRLARLTASCGAGVASLQQGPHALVSSSVLIAQAPLSWHPVLSLHHEAVTAGASPQ